MAKLVYYVIPLLLALLAITEAKGKGCRNGMRFRGGDCRTVFGMFKRLLDDIDQENEEDEEDDEHIQPNTDPEADLRALLYGQRFAGKQSAETAVIEVNETENSEAEESDSEDEDMNDADRHRKINKYEIEMDLVEFLLRDLENFDLES